MVDAAKVLVLAIVLVMPVGAAALTTPQESAESSSALSLFSSSTSPASSSLTNPALERIILRFDTHDDMDRFLQEEPVQLVYPVRTLPALVVDAPIELVPPLEDRPGVRWVQEDQELPLHLETSTRAIRADAVWGDRLDGPIAHPETGETIDGSGIGIAIIDTGIDGTHPDFEDRIVKNFRIISQIHHIGGPQVLDHHYIELENTDTQGHGTHVAGIAAGSGDAKRGAAPGASLYGFAANQGLHIWHSLAAWDWIVENHDQVDPPIRVVNNSYGCGGNAYNDDDIINQMVNLAVDAGIVVVFSAGNGDLLNNGGTGADDRTGGCSNNPRVLGVASYDDHDTGTRNGTVSAFSSRGSAASPSTWPDISAPGAQIEATAATVDPLFTRLFNPMIDALNDYTFSGSFQIVIDGTSSQEQSWYSGSPVAVYNAHDDTFVVEPTPPPTINHIPPFQIHEEHAKNMRFYQDVPASVGPVHPASGSDVNVQPGDRIEFYYEDGLANQVHLQITAPTGETAQISVPLDGCETTCTATLDLHERFPETPADGTWSLLFSADSDTETATKGGHTSKSGTSMAAPHVAGTAALILQADPSLTPKDVIDIMQTTAHKFEDGAAYEPLVHRPYVNSSFDKGAGLLDAHAAVLAAFDWEPLPDDLPEPGVPSLPPPENQTAVHRLQGNGTVQANCWTPEDCPQRLQFPVHEDAVGILAQLRWEAEAAQQVDLQIRSPNVCPTTDPIESMICILNGAVFKQQEGSYYAHGGGVPATHGEVSLWLDEETVQDHDCGRPWCSWSARAVPDLAFDLEYDLRVTIVNWGELPEDYTAFDD